MSTRDAMVISAVTLFRERGVAATSLRDVVDHAQAPRGSIYHHFPGGKAELAAAATRMAGDFIDSVLVGVLDDADPSTAIDKFVAYWEHALTKSDYEQGCPVAAAALSGSETPAARTLAGDAFAIWEARISDSLRRRGIPAPQARDLATLAICSIEGAILVARARRTTEPLRQVARQLRMAINAA